MPTREYRVQARIALRQARELQSALMASVAKSASPKSEKLAGMQRVQVLRRTLGLLFENTIPESVGPFDDEIVSFTQFYTMKKRGLYRTDQRNNISYILRAVRDVVTEEYRVRLDECIARLEQAEFPAYMIRRFESAD